ncbi:MAG: sarcosine oxidase subunit delta, partial [Pseudomonadota bacterium]|nr:sarcosine oxidase subunit delta [Pseudomonadota bacterium]
MLIPHPLLGLRDAQEFTYLGDAALIDRPDPAAGEAAFCDSVYLRDNPAGV